VYNNMLY